MPITKFEESAFEALQSAVRVGRLALMECTEAGTGNKATLICIVYPEESGPRVEMIPVARLFNEGFDPYEEYTPPNVGTARAGDNLFEVATELKERKPAKRAPIRKRSAN